MKTLFFCNHENSPSTQTSLHVPSLGRSEGSRAGDSSGGGGVLEDSRMCPLRHHEQRQRAWRGAGRCTPARTAFARSPCAGHSPGDGPGQRNSRFPHGFGARIPQGFTSVKKAKLCTKWCVSKPTCIFLTTTSTALIGRSEGPLRGPRTDRNPVLSVAPNRQHFTALLVPHGGGSSTVTTE